MQRKREGLVPIGEVLDLSRLDPHHPGFEGNRPLQRY